MHKTTEICRDLQKLLQKSLLAGFLWTLQAPWYVQDIGYKKVIGWFDYDFGARSSQVCITEQIAEKSMDIVIYTYFDATVDVF